MKLITNNRISLIIAAAIAGAILAACQTAPPPPPPAAPAPAPVAMPKPAPVPPAPVAVAPVAPLGATSSAGTPRDYRRDAAGHLYRQNGNRIYKGKMPPLLYAVGVLNVEIDSRGNVVSTNWMRAPSHAPEVMAEIVRTVRAAAPYPAPVRMGRVTYTDTWLWEKGGRFQLDTLTEGQL
jgi:periplasmic protein TonB